MFDRIKIYDDGYRCSEGHDLRGEEFQTKGLDCDLSDFAISRGRLQGKLAFTGELFIYTSCSQCPAFVQPESAVVVECWVEFKIDLVESGVRSIELVSTPSAAWAASEMRGGQRGPMTVAAAEDLARQIFGAQRSRAHGVG